MCTAIETESRRTSLAEVGVRFLDPQTTKIFTATHGLLHVEIRAQNWEGERLFRGVFAVMAFPISRARGKEISMCASL